MKIITFDVTNFPLQAAIVKTMMGVSFSKKNSEDTKAQCNEHLSSPKPEHTTVASGQGGAQWTAGWCGTGQNGMPTIRFACKKTFPAAPQRIVANRPEQLFGSTNKGTCENQGWNKTSG